MQLKDNVYHVSIWDKDWAVRKFVSTFFQTLEPILKYN